MKLSHGMVTGSCILFLAAVGAFCQEVPLSATIHEQTDQIVDGKVVKTLIRDMNFYRSSDGSTLMVPVGQGMIGGAVLWNNKTGVAYKLDLKGRIAYEDPHSSHVPNAPSRQAYQNFPDDSVEGIPCKIVPLYVQQTADYAGSSQTPGKTCFSAALGLELRSDVIVETGVSKTEHHIRQLSNIRAGVEPDPKLFDLSSYTVYGPKS